ncbi:MAG: stage II sporulation protein M [Clostridiales bacterium]|jgi:hypothetical protein|nr:stage II sporulation protein M [Clostridiales bacterium]
MRTRRFNPYDYGHSVRRHFRRHGLHYCLLALFFAAGIAIGCVTGGKLAGTMTVLDVNYIGMIRVLNVNLRFGTVFWNRVSNAAIFFLLIAFCGNSVWTLPLSHALLIWRGYVVGLNCAALTLFYGAGGVISALVYIVPHQLVLSATMSLLTALSCARRWERRRARREFDFFFCLRGLYPQFLWTYLLIAAFALIEALLLPMFTTLTL